MNNVKRTLISAAVCGAAFWVQGEGLPAVFWVSDPVLPGQTAVAVGEDFGEAPAVEVARLPDGRAVRCIHAEDAR